MRRTVDEAFLDLRRALDVWVREGAKPEIRIFVYPPEWEARMLSRFPRFAEDMAPTAPIDIVDAGKIFLAEVERRPGLEARLVEVEKRGPDGLLRDLGELGQRCLSRLLVAPLDPPAVARLLVNTGSLGTFVSYSAITNALHGGGPTASVAAPTVLAFPGEGDERQLNFMYLRPDTNYRVPRI